MIVSFFSLLLSCSLALVYAQIESNSWTNISEISNWKDITVDASGTVLYATQYGEYLMKSVDGGKTWKKYTNQYYYGNRENWEMVRVSKLDYHEILIGTYNTTGFFYFKDNSYFYPEFKGLSSLSCVFSLLSFSFSFLDKAYVYTDITISSIFYKPNSTSWSASVLLAHTKGIVFMGMSQYGYASGDRLSGKSITSIGISGNGTFAAAGATAGGLYFSSDGATHFDLLYALPGDHVYSAIAMSYDGLYTFVSSTYGTNYISSDFGKTWKVSSFVKSFSSIDCDYTGQYLVATTVNEDDNGLSEIWVSSNFGIDWILSKAPIEAGFPWRRAVTDSTGTRLFATNGEYLYGNIVKEDSGNDDYSAYYND
jgi:hypothetical protein